MASLDSTTMTTETTEEEEEEAVAVVVPFCRLPTTIMEEEGRSPEAGSEGLEEEVEEGEDEDLDTAVLGEEEVEEEAAASADCDTEEEVQEGELVVVEEEGTDRKTSMVRHEMCVPTSSPQPSFLFFIRR